jgi:hypothetical protein
VLNFSRIFFLLVIGSSCALVACTKQWLSTDNISEKDLKVAREAVKLSTSSGPDELKGLQVVEVAMDRVDDYAKVKITDYELLNPMSLKLRMAGLKVITFEQACQAPEHPDIPLIQQSLRTWTSESGDTMFSLETRVYEWVILTRNMSATTLAAIWQTNYPELDEVRNSQVHDAILKASQKQTDEFLGEFLKQKGL